MEPDAVCPITLESLEHLKWPVAFRNNPRQPYECEALVKWLLKTRTDPVTRRPVVWRVSALEVIAPLATHPEAAAAAKHIDHVLGEKTN